MNGQGDNTPDSRDFGPAGKKLDPYAPAPGPSDNAGSSDKGGPSDNAGPPKKSGGVTRGLAVGLLLLIVVNVGLLAVLSFNLFERAQPEEKRPARVAGSATATTPAPQASAAVTAPTLAPVPQPSAQLPTGSDLDADELRTVAIFRNAAPAVVFITTVEYRQDMFRRNVTSIPAGTGSGFVWDDSGHIVTNFHVIRGADAAKVTMADQTSYDAKLVGYAADKDIAVLRINAKTASLKPLSRGTSNTLVVGQSVFAIGNPFGLDHTLSTGVISGLEREIKSLAGRPIAGVIQTDAAINPGNSGGPLLDSKGRLIGINTAIYSPSGASAGIGFAVPVDTVRRIVPQLIRYGKVTRPGLGIRFDPELQKRNNIPGVLILGLSPGGAAEKAGLLPTTRDRASGRIVLGDIIVKLDDLEIKDQNDLFKALDRYKVGDVVKVKVKRGKTTKEVDLKLTELPQADD